MAFDHEAPETPSRELIPWRSLTVTLAGGPLSFALWIAVGNDLAFIVCVMATLMLSLLARARDDAH